MRFLVAVLPARSSIPTHPNLRSRTELTGESNLRIVRRRVGHDSSNECSTWKGVMNPKVSFVIPCYNLGHLLFDCVQSILAQTYQDFELLIMDDCSPDCTPGVAKSFTDARVKYVRNEANVGHLANYNKGIALARGEYVWLISADDSLRKTCVLERYVRLLEGNTQIGYVFCPAMQIENEHETNVMPSTMVSGEDMVFAGHRLLKERLLDTNCVPAPAAMARKQCYERLSFFPLDLPNAGDWYLWCLFALHYDVGYFAEPMVNRRLHENNMHLLFYKQPAAFFADNLAVLTRTKEEAEREGYRSVVNSCIQALSAEYLRQLIPPAPGNPIQAHITIGEFEESLSRRVCSLHDQKKIRAGVYFGLGDYSYGCRDFFRALQCYRCALEQTDYWKSGLSGSMLPSPRSFSSWENPVRGAEYPNLLNS